MELPHPVPVRPEASPAPSFVETKKTDDRDLSPAQNEDEDDLGEQQSQQVSPVPSKKPERFASSLPSSKNSSAVKMSSGKRIKKDSPAAMKGNSPDMQQSQSSSGLLSSVLKQRSERRKNATKDEDFFAKELAES